jgi:hypothetical protein
MPFLAAELAAKDLISGFTAVVPSGARSRFAIPGGLVMGEARMGDVQAARGPPLREDTWSTESTVL